MCESFARLLFSSTQVAAFEPEPFVVNANCTVGDVHALLDSIPTVCGRMAKESPDPQPQARGAGSTTEPASSHWDTWALMHERPRRRWRDMTDDSETDEDAVVRSVAPGPTAAARAVDANAVATAGAANFDQAAPANAGDAMVGPEAAAAGAGVGECAANPAHAMVGPEAAGAGVCAATPRTVRICEVALGIFVNAAGERCDRCLILVKFSVAQVSIVSFNLKCMP